MSRKAARHSTHSGNISALNKAIVEFPGVLITGVRGRASGLGVGLILRSDIAIAATDARFALDEVKIGIPPMFIMEQILEHLPAKRALDFVLTGRICGPRFTISLKRSTLILQLSTSWQADYPIFWHLCDVTR